MPLAAAAVIGAGASLYGANKQSKAAQSAANMQAQSAAASNEELRRQFDIGQKNLNPYMQAGQQAGLNPLVAGMNNGSLTRAFGMQDFQADPGYQWRKQQGLDGLQQQAASRGSLLSGSTLKALADYNQNLASGEYNNAYNRFNDNQQNQFNRLSALATMGQNSAAGSANMGMQFANSYGDNLTSGASAIGNGMINSANARANGLNNLVGIGSQMAGLYEMKKSGFF